MELTPQSMLCWSESFQALPEVAQNWIAVQEPCKHVQRNSKLENHKLKHKQQIYVLYELFVTAFATEVD